MVCRSFTVSTLVSWTRTGSGIKKVSKLEGPSWLDSVIPEISCALGLPQINEEEDTQSKI